MGFICQQLRISPLGRAILAHLHEQADYSSALYISNSRRIAEDINSVRKRVAWEQLKLKRAGLIAYASDEGNKTHAYFMPLVIISKPDAAATRITRLFGESVYAATALGAIDESAGDPESQLMEMMFNAGGRWVHDELMRAIFSKVVEEMTPAAILTPEKSLRPTKKKKNIADETVTNDYLAKIGRILAGSGESNYATQ